MTPIEDFTYLLNHVLLGEEPTIEDFILLVGTMVAFIAFVLWCCFPIKTKDAGNHRQFSCKAMQHNANSGFDEAQHINGGGNSVSSSSYSKSPPIVHNDYSIKNGHTYHCCS